MDELYTLLLAAREALIFIRKIDGIELGELADRLQTGIEGVEKHIEEKNYDFSDAEIV
jgi:hypothetical protein